MRVSKKAEKAVKRSGKAAKRLKKTPFPIKLLKPLYKHRKGLGKIIYSVMYLTTKKNED